jgi:uncharacterized protein YceH (UPF0502 family)
MQLFTGAEPPPAAEQATSAAAERTPADGRLESRVETLERAVAELRRELEKLRDPSRDQ